MKTYRVPEHVIRASLQEDDVLLNTETGVYHLVNETGRSLLASFEEGLTLEDAARRLQAETGELESTIARDARGFVEAMMDRGLLEEASREDSRGPVKRAG